MFDQNQSGPSEKERGRRAWRVLVDFAQPRQPADEHWVAAAVNALQVWLGLLRP